MAFTILFYKQTSGGNHEGLGDQVPGIRLMKMKDFDSRDEWATFFSKPGVTGVST